MKTITFYAIRAREKDIDWDNQAAVNDEFHGELDFNSMVNILNDIQKRGIENYNVIDLYITTCIYEDGSPIPMYPSDESVVNTVDEHITLVGPPGCW